MRILIVDDNESLREGLAVELEVLGNRVDTASNGIEALKKIKDNGFDVLLTDMNMPEMDGIILIKKVIENGLDVKIILMSGSDLQNNTASFTRIEKPFRIEELLGVLGMNDV